LLHLSPWQQKSGNPAVVAPADSISETIGACGYPTRRSGFTDSGDNAFG